MILTVALNAAVDKTHIIPGFHLEGVNRPHQVLAMAGGKGLNVARVLATLGEPVLATGLVAGHAGAFIEECLAAEGVPHAFQRLPHGESRTCLAIVHPETGTQTEVHEPGPYVDAGAVAAFTARFQDLLPDARWVALSGSLPPGLDPGIYLALLAAAKALGKPVSLDCSGRALALAIAGKPTVVKPNQFEAEEVLGVRITPENLPRALEALLERGPQIVALSLGAAGAAFASGSEAWFIAAPAIRVLNPIGSGDSFLAALVAGLLRGQTLAEAGQMAVAAGTANAGVAGAAACTRAQIEALVPAVRVAPLAEARWEAEVLRGSPLPHGAGAAG